jgi:hypothetical protein
MLKLEGNSAKPVKTKKPNASKQASQTEINKFQAAVGGPFDCYICGRRHKDPDSPVVRNCLAVEMARLVITFQGGDEWVIGSIGRDEKRPNLVYVLEPGFDNGWNEPDIHDIDEFLMGAINPSVKTRIDNLRNGVCMSTIPLYTLATRDCRKRIKENLLEAMKKVKEHFDSITKEAKKLHDDFLGGLAKHAIGVKTQELSIENEYTITVNGKSRNVSECQVVDYVLRGVEGEFHNHSASPIRIKDFYQDKKGVLTAEIENGGTVWICTHTHPPVDEATGKVCKGAEGFFHDSLI